MRWFLQETLIIWGETGFAMGNKWGCYGLDMGLQWVLNGGCMGLYLQKKSRMKI